MEEKVAPSMDRIVSALGQFPPVVMEEFAKARALMSTHLNEKQLIRWADTGLELAKQTVRSWEAAGQYYRAGPEIAGLMPYNYFLKWSECGNSLCKESPTLAACYLEASPGVMARLRPRHIETWTNLGRSLYKGTWKSSTLSCKLYESSPALLESLTVPELERFVRLLDALSHRSYDVSIECLTLGQKIFPLLGENKGLFLSLGSSLVEKSWRQVKSFFETSTVALPRIEVDQRARFLRLADRLLEGGNPNVPAIMLDISGSLSRREGKSHARLLDLAERLLDVSAEAMPDFVRSAPSALDRVSMSQLETWFEEGIRVTDRNRDGGLAYFRVESAHSQAVLEGLSSSIELTKVSGLMEMYCRALAGADVKLEASRELVEKNIGWVSEKAPSTEGSTVFVPSNVDRYATKEENFAWLKVVSTHQIAHLEFDSFGFQYARPSTRFQDLRPKLADGSTDRERDGSPGADGASGWATDMQRFFDLFADRALALDIFTVVEDARLDARIKTEYAGIKAAYERVQRDSIEGRSEVQSLPMREAMVEFLLRHSLQQYSGLPVPTRFVDEARKIAAVAGRVLDARATVEDAAEATLRIYAIISQVPNEELDGDDWEEIDVDDQPDEGYSDAEDEILLQQLMQGGTSGAQSGEEQDYTPAEAVDFRGEFKPEMVQLLTQLRMQEGEGAGEANTEAITQEMLEELLKSSAELDLEAAQSDAQQSSGALSSNLLKEVALSAPQRSQLGHGPLGHVDEDGTSLDASEPQTFAYDEWDFRADDYKPSWCIVRQKTMAEGDPSYYGDTLHAYAPLVEQIRRQFEQLVPEMFRKVRKLEDGDDINIDDVIEAFIDIRTGVSPSEKLYWKRNKVQRDVAVVFLLDTSASTAEAIDDSTKLTDEWEAPRDPVEYMVWLRKRRGEGARRSYKRIIDLEKEAVVLLIHALEAVGDTYGIYGFSGYGRENVEFYTVKDIDEQFSDKVKSRIDRISPLHATRMGPAIRHATFKLESQEARTKLLFLISDGRPQDRGYSREGVEKEYAVHDTKMALDEARDKNINAFCLTVDKNGHDYLKAMCQDMGYEVLDDIHALPRRLLYLYRKLTM